MRVAKTAGSSFRRGEFFFLGNHLALDLLNTRPLQNGEVLELLPDFDALLRWFRAAGLLSSREVTNLRRQWAGSARAQRVTEAMRELRERLRKQVLAVERTGTVHGDAIHELNRLMAKHPMLTRLKASGRAATIESWFDSRHPEDLFAPLAHSAARLFAEVDRTRIRKCGQCVLHFYDTSKKGKRRWCSMQLCGNRLKVAAYTARRRRNRRN